MSQQQALRAALALAKNPLWIYQNAQMAPFQRDFHQSQERKRLQLAANKVGKTFGAAAEAWWYLMGWHPWREVPPRGSLGWLLCQDHTTGWPSVSRCLRDLEPPGALSSECKYVEGVGYLYRSKKMLVTAWGSILECKSCKQDLMALEGPRVHWAWVDEPPKKGHFQALRARLTFDMGHLWMTLTPVNRPTEWLRELADGNDEEGTPPLEDDWFVQHIELNKRNAPHRTQESIDAQIAETDEWERAQRIYAKWEGMAKGRRLSRFSPSLIIDDEVVGRLVLSGKSDLVRVGIDHGEGLGKQVVSIVARIDGRFYLLAQWAAPEDGMGAKETAQAVLDLLEVLGLGIQHVDRIFGDINTAGLGVRGSFKFNQLVEYELAQLLGVSQCPKQVESPTKSAGSVRAGESAINALMGEKRWLVHEDCMPFIRSARYYTGIEADLKDPIDSARYAVLDLLLDPRLLTRDTAPMLVL